MDSSKKIRMRCIQAIGYCEPGKRYWLRERPLLGFNPPVYKIYDEDDDLCTGYTQPGFALADYFEPEHASFDNALDELLK